VVDAWQIQSWEEYRDVRRLGRKTRLSEQQRLTLWAVFEQVKSGLREQGLVTQAEIFNVLARELKARRYPPFDFAVVDEAQDINVSQLRFLAALAGDKPNGLFFAGDLGQRIFQTPFSWKLLGVDIRGRSRTLRINYRTSHQIRMQADRLLGPQVSDVDGNVEDRRGTVSVFNGPSPDIVVLDTVEQEIDEVSTWLASLVKEGILPHEIGIFVRSPAQLTRARDAAQKSGVPFNVLDEHMEITNGRMVICTMHLAKGLEFRAVAVMACDDEIIPLQERMETVADDADLEEVYDTERHLLYVACTRARDRLLVTSVDPASEFLDDLNG
jgi:superfamily I DNA/RNA helicase